MERMKHLLPLPIRYALFVSALAGCSVLSAQRTCGTMEYLQHQIEADPSRAIRLQQADEHAAQYALEHVNDDQRSLVIIPVVVHVVWKTTAENVSDARVMAQIDQLNLDYSRANSDAGNTPSAFTGVAANTDIQFCLAQRDPDGNPTTGIDRRQTSVNSFSTNDNVKHYSNGGSDAWPRDSYLNLWVCDLSGGLLGYSQFPGGPAGTDGVVVLYGSVGSLTVPGTENSYQYGRSATHEVGHWMNLLHIWGDDGNACNGSDQVADTPNQGGPNYGCPSFPHVSCSNGPNGDMYMDYMDYADDNCMNLFTNGQASRMQSVFSTGGARASIMNSMGCIAPGGGTTCAVPSGLSTTGITSSSASISWNAVQSAISYTVRYRPVGNGNWESMTVPSNNGSISALSPSTDYEWQVLTNCANGISDYSSSANFTTLSGSSVCSDIYEPNNTKNAAPTIAANTDIQALLAVRKDKDWFKFSNTASQPNIRIDLTNLPADYDVKLYKGGTLLGTGQNSGTTNEQLVYNSSSVGTYSIVVYGYHNAFDPDNCYTLRASISGNTFRERDTRTIQIPVSKEQGQLALYPNPTTGEVVLEYTAATDCTVELNVLDALGQSVLSSSDAVRTGTNTINIALPEVPNGIYLVRVTEGGTSTMQRLMVSH